MVICSLDTLKKSSKKKETRIKKKIAEVFQKASYRRKRTENYKTTEYLHMKGALDSIQ